MGWTFNSPPGWPEQPAGWSPPPGWTPDPSWPPPPAGWQFWVATPPGPAAATAYRPPQPPDRPPPGQPPRPWFARWWGVLGLAGALVVGGLVGFAGTSLALSGDDGGGTPAALDTPQPSASASAVAPTGEPEPSPGPTGLPTGGPEQMCGEVAVIVLQMVGENLTAFDEDDPQAALVASRRAAAERLREVEAADDADRDALDTFADELDASADDLQGGPLTEDRYTEFVDRGTVAWDDFNAAAGC